MGCLLSPAACGSAKSMSRDLFLAAAAAGSWLLVLADVSALGVCSSGNQDPPRQRSGVEGGLEATGPVNLARGGSRERKEGSHRRRERGGVAVELHIAGRGREKGFRPVLGGEAREESFDDGPCSGLVALEMCSLKPSMLG